MENNMKTYFRKIEPVMVANACNTMTYRDGGGGGLPKAVGYIVSYRPSWSTKETEIQYAPRNPTTECMSIGSRIITWKRHLYSQVYCNTTPDNREI